MEPDDETTQLTIPFEGRSPSGRCRNGTRNDDRISRTAQHMRALERANSVRLARAELKRAVARGDLDPAEVVRDCPWQTESMTISELLTSQRRWGRTRARKFLCRSR